MRTDTLFISIAHVTLKQLVTQINSTTQLWPGKPVDLLNTRTCYFYRNQGLLDPPMQAGPLAQYGDQHLKQLLAIKVLQKAGKSLADIKTELTGLTPTQLSNILLNSGVEVKLKNAEKNGTASATPRREDFPHELPTQTVAPWGPIQVQEADTLFNRHIEWSCHPINRFFTIIGAPGAPNIPLQVQHQIQQLLNRL